MKHFWRGFTGIFITFDEYDMEALGSLFAICIIVPVVVTLTFTILISFIK
jgi:hypothetical protein